MLSASVLLTSCKDEIDSNPNTETNNPNTINKSFPNVDQRLWSYFEKFEIEGQRRGHNTDLIAGGITADFASLEGSVAGRCTFNGNHTVHHITMDIEFWNQFPENIKEMIVFHELGHCYLHRDHNESQFSNGVCRSIMRSGLGDCIDNYQSSTRDNYLDELFSNS